MKKKRKRIVWIVLIVIISGVGGCMKNNSSSSFLGFLMGDTSKKNKVIRYLEERYHDSFEFVDYGDDGGVSGKTMEYYMRKIGDTREFRVQFSPDHMKDIKDSYSSLLYQEEVKEYLYNLASEIYGEDVKVFPELESVFFGTWKPSISSALDFLQSGWAMDMAILVPASLVESKESMVEELRQRFADNKIYPEGSIYYLIDNDILSKVTQSNYVDYIRLPYSNVYGHFNMDDEGNFLYMDWRVRE